MGHSIDGLQRIGVKLALAKQDAPNLAKVIPVMHRWIQDRSVNGLLIDVADYSHVPQGPGVMLVAHEGNYALDVGGGRVGVLYYSKQPLDGDLGDRLRSVCATALRAACLLEQDDALGADARIAGDEIEIVANDRLLAPNDTSSDEAFRPTLDAFLDRLFDGGSRELCRDEDPRERFNVHVKAAAAVDAATMLSRLS